MTNQSHRTKRGSYTGTGGTQKYECEGSHAGSGSSGSHSNRAGRGLQKEQGFCLILLYGKITSTDHWVHACSAMLNLDVCMIYWNDLVPCWTIFYVFNATRGIEWWVGILWKVIEDWIMASIFHDLIWECFSYEIDWSHSMLLTYDKL